MAADRLLLVNTCLLADCPSITFPFFLSCNLQWNVQVRLCACTKSSPHSALCAVWLLEALLYHTDGWRKEAHDRVICSMWWVQEFHCNNLLQRRCGNVCPSNGDLLMNCVGMDPQPRLLQSVPYCHAWCWGSHAYSPSVHVH